MVTQFSTAAVGSVSPFETVHQRSSMPAPERATAYTTGLSKRKLQRAIDYIHQHLAEKVSLEAIASHLNMSQFHFCRLFKQSMGVSPYQYLLHLRIERAKELLLDDERYIADIALEVGFSNQGHLSRQFKRFVGMSPRQFARQSSGSTPKGPA